jgi:hypothetical protein
MSHYVGNFFKMTQTYHILVAKVHYKEKNKIINPKIKYWLINNQKLKSDFFLRLSMFSNVWAEITIRER